MAAAGIAAGVGDGLAREFRLPGLDAARGQSLGNIAAHTAVGAASLLASAATRSAIEGSSFGRNIMAGLPDVIGQVIGRALVGAAQGGQANSAIAEKFGRDSVAEETLALVYSFDLSANNPLTVLIATAQLIEEMQSMASEHGERDPTLGIENDLQYIQDALLIGTARVAQAHRIAGSLDGPDIRSASVGEAYARMAGRVGGAELEQFTRIALKQARKEIHDLDPVLADLPGALATVANEYLGPVGKTALWVSAEIENNVWARYTLEALSFASGPVSYIAAELFARSPAGKLAADGIGEAAAWLRGFGVTDNAIVGGVALVGLAFGVKPAVRFINDAKYALALAVIRPKNLPSLPRTQAIERSAAGSAPRIIQLSKARFGHAFSTHGQDATEFLTRRAAGSGMPQGQFLDDQAAARFILDNVAKTRDGPVSLPIPNGFPARVIMPDGSFAVPTSIRLVPGGKGVKTAYPE